jgi:hypothetical protein
MPTLSTHVAIVECASAAQLEEILSAGLNRFTVRTLGEAAVVVDHERLAEVHKLLRHVGQTPRVVPE